MRYEDTLRVMQDERKLWAEKNFPGKGRDYTTLLGVVEEVGELAHAHLKAAEGIRYSTGEARQLKADAIGDTIVFLAAYCDENGFDLQACVVTAWNKVFMRDWVANPMDADKKVPS